MSYNTTLVHNNDVDAPLTLCWTSLRMKCPVQDLHFSTWHTDQQHQFWGFVLTCRHCWFGTPLFTTTSALYHWLYVDVSTEIQHSQPPQACTKYSVLECATHEKSLNSHWFVLGCLLANLKQNRYMATVKSRQPQGMQEELGMVVVVGLADNYTVYQISRYPKWMRGQKPFE